MRVWIALAVTGAAAFLILVHFHDRYWFARDEGYYAQIAARILAGDVIHRDIQALHTGLIYFVNALALGLFGHDFVALRYPLILSGTLQAVLAFLVVASRGILPAVAAGIAGASLTVVQFFNPTPHWYCLTLFFIIVIGLGPTFRANRWRLETIGLLLATMFLFRQLTGVFVAMGVLTWLLIEADPSGRRDRWMARTIILIMGIGIVGYLRSKTDLVGWLAFGLWPLLVLARAWRVVALDNRRCLLLIARLSTGAAAAFVPLLIYHLATGSFGAWITDSFIDAIALGEFEYQKTARYGAFVAIAFRQLADPADPVAFLNGLYWPLLVLATMVLGVITAVRFDQVLSKRESASSLPILAVFYGLVAVHYQDPAYLYFVAGSTAAAVLWHAAAFRFPGRAAVIALVGFQSAVGLYSHAAQPITRSYMDSLAGVRIPVTRSTHPALRSLMMTESDQQTYEAVLGLIEQESRATEPILTIPANADLYFLSNRRNPLPYLFVQFGVRDDRTAAAALERLRADPPRLVIHVPSLPYNTPYTGRIMDFVRSGYDRIAKIREFIVYRRRT